MLRNVFAAYKKAYAGLPRNAWLLSLVQFINRGRHMGLFGVSFSLAFMIGPLTGARIYTLFSPQALWLGCGGMGIILILSFSMLESWNHRSELLP